jgi:hypothetical protein
MPVTGCRYHLPPGIWNFFFWNFLFGVFPLLNFDFLIFREASYQDADIIFLLEFGIFFIWNFLFGVF